MTGPLAKADALLSARLAPWVELSARQAPAGAEEAAPPVARAPRVDNDLLLPARANLQLHASVQSRAALPIGAARPDAGGTGIALSSAARAIFALASGMPAGQATAVGGSGPLWPAQRQAPAAQALASALSRQLSESGLFYESHLAEFAGGARSLAQMQREPQAGLARGRAVQETEPHGPQPRQPPGVLPMPGAPAPAGAMPAASASTVAALMPALPLQQAPQQAGQEPVTAAGHTKPEPAAMQGAPAVSVDSALSRHEHVATAAHAQSAAAADSAMPADALPAAASAVVHPQAAALVHQQLDLLAGAMFRWSGEAWPGVPMEWTVQEEGGRRHTDEDEDHSPVQWATTLTLDLPRLGAVKVALKLDGQSVHARLAANDEPTTDRLRSGAEGLTRRMSQAGLELQSLALGAEVTAP
mgnify:CR=1 FL=1